MFEFKGIDLNTKYIKPSTWDWLAVQADNPNGVVEAHIYDSGCGMLVWTYSIDENDFELPPDLKRIVDEAYLRAWRFIVFDCDGADCELFPSYEKEWP